MDTIKAVVQKVIRGGRHGPFAVATSDQLEDSVTFSLEPTVWEEAEWPERGVMVFLGKIRQKRAGWRAKQGRFWKPSDEQTQQTERSKEMKNAMASIDVFKPFLIEGGRDGKNIFRVVEVAKGVSRDQIEKLFEGLPIAFHLRKECSIKVEDINEPIEVYVLGAIVYIYPPRHRVIVCTTFDSWGSADVVSKMHVDNVMDTVFPGNGQLRSCVHFDPAIFDIDGWPNTETTELEIDIHVYPKGKESEPKLEAFSFGKFEVARLLDLIAGGKQLTIEQLKEWHNLIMYAVKSMRLCYENPDTPEDDPRRVYYKPCWEEIEATRENDEKLIRALESLRSSIKWQ